MRPIDHDHRWQPSNPRTDPLAHEHADPLTHEQTYGHTTLKKKKPKKTTTYVNPLVGNLGRLTWIRLHSSRKSSATHFYLCVQYCRVSNGGIWLPVFGFFNVRYTHNYVDTRDCLWLGAVGTSIAYSWGL